VVIALFYSAKFGAAVEVLRWICLGTTLQVITWPMGFIIVAKGEQNIFFWAELAWTVVNVGFVDLCEIIWLERRRHCVLCIPISFTGF
jgi:PST family polysaccharide transporter